jgi:hypothetical protein
MMKHRIAKLWKATVAVGGFVALASLASAQATVPLYEPFNYPAGDPLVGKTINGGTWTQTGANASSPVTIQASSLTYAGLPASQGGSIQLINGSGAQDPGLDITTQTAGSVYASFILNVTNAGSVASGDYIFQFSSAGTGATDYHARLFVQPGSTADNFKLGLRFYSSDTILTSEDYPVNTPVLVVVAYNINASTADDTASLWVNPTLGQTSAPTAIGTTAAGVADLANGVARVNFRQGTASTAQVVLVDELRVSTSWADVTPSASGVNDWTMY